MLAILTSHPIQYQAPIWRALAASGKVPFQVWYLSDHGVARSLDAEFGKRFSWDMDLLEGYPHCRLDVNDNCDLRSFHGVRLREDLSRRLRRQNVRALWAEGWRFRALWQAVKAAKRCGVEVWMRGDSNDLKREHRWKRLAKRSILGWHLARVDRFLCVGSANRRLYASYGFGKSRMISTPHCVDNDRFVQQAEQLRSQRNELRARWGIPGDAFCFLFCGKLITKKRPQDIIQAAQLLLQRHATNRPIHLLFVGSGALGGRLRRVCRVAYDAEPGAYPSAIEAPSEDAVDAPTASFAGFLNQSEIAAAYVAADALVLPSDFSETWGLVVNEAMACGLPALASDQCGCAEDLPAQIDPQLVFRYGDVGDLVRAMQFIINEPAPLRRIQEAVDEHHLRHTVAAIEELYVRVTGRGATTAEQAKRRELIP